MTAPRIHGIERLIVRREEHHARKQIVRDGQQRDLRFEHDAQRSFRSAEQIDPIGPSRKPVPGRILTRTRRRNGFHRNIRHIAPPELANAAIEQRHPQTKHMPPRTAIPKAARPAGIRRDRPANGRRDLRRIRRKKLPRSHRRIPNLQQRHGRPHPRASLPDFQLAELLQRQHRPTMRHARAGQASARACDRYGRAAFGRRCAESRPLPPRSPG